MKFEKETVIILNFWESFSQWQGGLMAITLACKVRNPGSNPGLYKILICETRFAKIPIMKHLPEICFKKRVFVACLLLLFNPNPTVY